MALYFTQQAALYQSAVGTVTGSPGSWEALANASLLQRTHRRKKPVILKQSLCSDFSLIISCIAVAGDLPLMVQNITFCS